jgi:hypothetical protein
LNDNIFSKTMGLTALLIIGASQFANVSKNINQDVWEIMGLMVPG